MLPAKAPIIAVSRSLGSLRACIENKVFMLLNAKFVII